MRDAVILSTARTGLAKAGRGSFNNTHGITMAGTAIKGAMERAGIDPGVVEDVYLGCAQPEGATGHNVARNAALWAGCPSTASGATINRFCSSGLQAIANAAHTVINEGAPVAIGGGVKSLSLVSRSGHMNVHRYTEDELMKKWPAIWMTMIETAEIVADRYGVSREYQDEYALRSQQRTAAAQQRGAFDDEIVPLPYGAASANVELGDFGVEGLVGLFSIEVDDVDVYYLDLDVNAYYQFLDMAGMGSRLVAGWRYIEVEAEYDDGDEQIDADLDFSGPYVGLSLVL